MADELRAVEILVEPPTAREPAAPADRSPGDPVRRGWSPRWARWPRGRPARAALLVAAAVAILALGAFVRDRGDEGGGSAALDRAAVDKVVDDKVAKAVQQLQGAPARSAEVYRSILPSIVVIRSAGPAASGESGLGTGVVVNADGSIMTAFHVVDGADSLTITFADGTTSGAVVKSGDRATDIAVLTPATKPEVVVPATLGGGVRVGDDTYAVGHPLGLVGSLSAGVISGLDRSIPRGDGAGRLTGLIQFDAAVNPGNSGGPLLDRNGRVVGIVTAIADPSQDGSFIGIGFAVPIATAGGTAGAPAR